PTGSPGRRLWPAAAGSPPRWNRRLENFLPGSPMLALIAEYGLALVFANVLIQQMGLPVPVVPTLFVAGALAANGNLSTSAVFAVAIAACAISDATWYVAGRIYGRRLLEALCRISLSPDSCI